MARKHLDCKYPEFVRTEVGSGQGGSLQIYIALLKTLGKLAPATVKEHPFTARDENLPTKEILFPHQQNNTGGCFLATAGFYFTLATGGRLSVAHSLSPEPMLIKIDLNHIWTLFLSFPLAWNHSVINLSLVWSMLFLDWLITRHYPVCYCLWSSQSKHVFINSRQRQNLSMNLPPETNRSLILVAVKLL